MRWGNGFKRSHQTNKILKQIIILIRIIKFHTLNPCEIIYKTIKEISEVKGKNRTRVHNHHLKFVNYTLYMYLKNLTLVSGGDDDANDVNDDDVADLLSYLFIYLFSLVGLYILFGMYDKWFTGFFFFNFIKTGNVLSLYFTKSQKVHVIHTGISCKYIVIYITAFPLSS